MLVWTIELLTRPTPPFAEPLDAPDSPDVSESHAWPSVLAGRASPFSMTKVGQRNGCSILRACVKVFASAAASMIKH